MTNILGLHFGHDGSVCLVKDGRLECAIATERITRIKKDHAFTDDVIDYVLNESNLTLDDIDCVALGDFNQQIFGNEYITDTFEIKGKKIKSYIIDHHLTHCASVYYTSPFKDAYCFSILQQQQFHQEFLEFLKYMLHYEELQQHHKEF